MWFSSPRNMVKNPKWQESDPEDIYKHGQGAELEATDKHLQLATRAGLKPRTSGSLAL